MVNERRTLQKMKEWVKKSKDHCLGCIKEPLLNIEVDHVAIDKLHLMLRVTDVLLRNLVWAIISRDRKEAHCGPMRTASLDRLVDTIKSCGVYFRVSLLHFTGVHNLHLC